MIRRLKRAIYKVIDKWFSALDKRMIRRHQNIKRIPNASIRRGGKLSLIEWSHVIGIFQSLIGLNLPKDKKGIKILDIGCGTGLLGIASEPYVLNNGEYIGIDVMRNDIEFCKQHYSAPHFRFMHHDIFNPTYSVNQSRDKTPWAIDSNSIDLVTALSVWTHLNEEDAIFYFKEIERVLKKGGRAIITFFVLDEDYYNVSIQRREDGISKYHSTKQKRWIFDVEAYGSPNWLTTKWVKNPEDAIGVTSDGISKLIKGLDLEVKQMYPGNWREQSGLYFQDILTLEKR